MQRTLGAAFLAQQAWKQVPVSERARICRAFADAFEKHRDSIASELSWQMGRPVSVAPGEVRGTLERARYMIDAASEALRDIDVGPKAGFTRFIRREPLGVVLTIAAWNYPYLIAVNSIVPALMAGNTVILKHSAQTPLCAEQFASCFREAGLRGVMQVLHLTHADTERVIRDPRISFVAFTGSVEGGHAIQRAAADRFIGTGLELGGNDPAYVRPDANFVHAVESLVDGAFFNSGQSCCGIGRIYVHDAIYERFVAAFVDLTSQYRLGNPLESETTLGPVVRTQAADSIRRSVAEAIYSGCASPDRRNAIRRESTGHSISRSASARRYTTRHADRPGGDLRAGREHCARDYGRGGDPPDERQPLRTDRVGVDCGRESRNRNWRAHRYRNLVHESLRLSRSGVGLGGREGLRSWLHLVGGRLRASDAAEIVSSSDLDLKAQERQ